MRLSQRCEYWWDDQVKFGLSVTAEPALEPVTPEEVRANLRVDLPDEDRWLLGRITSARQLCEVFLKRAFVETTFRLTLKTFPSVEFYMPRPRLRSVTSIKYLDTSGVQQTMSVSDYMVDTYTEPGIIAPAYGLSWPSHREFTNSIEVIYKAGYGTTAVSVPRNVRDAIIVAVTHWSEFRGDDEPDQMALPEISKTLLRASAWGYLP